MSIANFLPYCGHPPVPGDLIWNTDPILISGLLGIAIVYLARSFGSDGLSPNERRCFVIGWGVVAAALTSPLCNLSVALFSARVTQHIVLTLVAAPLVVLGRPERAFAAFLPLRMVGALLKKHGMGIGAAGFAVTMWTWHLPGPYDATLQNNYAYWAMHITTFGSALIFWHALLFHGATRTGSALVAAFGTAMQMSLLGAVLTLAPRALFAVHSTTTWPWGLSPLEDQQLGGLIMWVPAGVLFTVYGIVAFGRWMASFEAAPATLEIGGSAARN
ncbi:MAG TPA: cytochrome c oxidase assembly protein [Xanthobacteraceae bacterium]|jgi:putative membrane protein